MARIEQLRLDAQREAGLAADADESIERLQWEEEQLARASEGYDEKLAEAVEAAHEASDVLADVEAHLTEATEDVAPPVRAPPIADPAGRRCPRRG